MSFFCHTIECLLKAMYDIFGADQLNHYSHYYILIWVVKENFGDAYYP